MPKEVPLIKIEDSGKRSNTKFKRIKTLLRKCKELANLCELDIELLIYDNKQHLLTEYSSKPERDINFFNDLLEKTKIQAIDSLGGDMFIKSNKHRP